MWIVCPETCSPGGAWGDGSSLAKPWQWKPSFHPGSPSPTFDPIYEWSEILACGCETPPVGNRCLWMFFWACHFVKWPQCHTILTAGARHLSQGSAWIQHPIPSWPDYNTHPRLSSPWWVKQWNSLLFITCMESAPCIHKIFKYAQNTCDNRIQ